MSQEILITGASGFIGRALLERLGDFANIKLIALTRKRHSGLYPAETYISNGDYSTEELPLRCAQTVIHLAGRAHVLNETNVDPLSEFRAVNVEATLALARKSLAAGVKRFIFISSVGVNGNVTIGSPFTENSKPAPHAAYAVSKYEAEMGLQKLTAGTDMELVIIRPPLVYAANAPGNFGKLLKLVAFGAPLPFGSVRNQRSIIALENLIEFIVLCVNHPRAANEIFLVSDGADVSTADMIRYIAAGMGRKVLLPPVPLPLIRMFANCVNKGGAFEQLCGSLVVDSSRAHELLNWKPVITASRALANAGRDYLRSSKA